MDPTGSRRTVGEVERDTSAIFEELTRDMEAEIAERRARELMLRRRRAPKILLFGLGGLLFTVVVGLRSPIAGVGSFLLLTFALERAIANSTRTDRR